MRSLILPALLLLLASLAACGGSGDDNGDDSTPAGDPTPTAADDGADNGDDDPTPDDTDDNDDGPPAEGIAALSEGDCFDASLTPEETIDFATVTEADCDEPHTGEVVLVAAPDTDGDYPGELRLRQVSRDVCEPSVFDEYLGSEMPSGLSRQFPIPSEQSWNDGIRNIICLVYLKNAQLQGSLSGVGHDVFPVGFPTDAPRPDAISLISVGSLDNPSPGVRSLLEDSEIEPDGLISAVFFLVDPDTIDEAGPSIEDAIGPSGWSVLSSDPDAGAFVLEKDGRQLIIFSRTPLTVDYYYHPE